MKMLALLAAIVLTSTLSGCSGSNMEKVTPPAASKDRPSTPPPVSVTAACDLIGKETPHVTLEDAGNEFILTFTGAPISRGGTTGYFASVFDKAGENGAQLGITFRNGAPESYFVFDVGTANQTNLDDRAEVRGDKIIGTFPKSSGNLGDIDVSQWNAALTRSGKDIAGCPDLNGDEYMQPFPG